MPGSLTKTGALLIALTATARAAPSNAAPAVAPDAGKLAAALHDVGTRALAEAARRATRIDEAPDPLARPAAASAVSHALIPALGPCTRPSYDERTKLGEQLARRVPHSGELALAFGCKDAAGVVVWLAFDEPRPRAEQGVWRVVRVAPSGITTLAEDKGPAQSTWGEAAAIASVPEVTLRPVVQLDVDVDGVADIVLERDDHEGGVRHGAATLSVWLSRAKRRVALGSTGALRDLVDVAKRQPAGGHTVVLQLRHDRDSVADALYRCVEPPGQLTICPAVDPARRFDRAVEIATWFTSGHGYPPGDAMVPDRGQLAELLLPLQGFGVTASERGKLLALAALPTPEQAIAHEVTRVRGLEVARQYGEIVERPDLRAARLLGMLGDAACRTITAAEARAANARLAAWIAGHDQADAAAEACKGDPACTVKRTGPLALREACVAGKLAYYEAQWSYALSGAEGEPLERRAVLRAEGEHLTVLARELATAQTPLGLTAKLYRHGATLIAMALAPGRGAEPPQLIVDVDGQPVAVPESPGALSWVELGASTADNLVRYAASATEVAYLRWDGGWKQIARYPLPTARTPSPKLDPIATWLWQQDHKAIAQQHLRGFDLAQWSKDPAYRAETLQALAVAGADPATLGRATAATGAVK